MPGAYAHMTLANCMRETHRLDAIPGFPDDAKRAVLSHFEFVELGAVSPDYPYLAIGDGASSKWADAMHYPFAGKVISAGIDLLRGRTGEAREKCLAWLLGYTSHVVADMTIHPVVEMMVGRYEENKMNHRECEMNQDAEIFERLNVGQIGLSNHLRNGIARCGSGTNLDSDIAALWNDMLRTIYPAEYLNNTPDVHKWHRGFIGVVSTISQGQRLTPLARHVAAGVGLTYPAPDDVAEKFRENLAVPGGTLNYKDLFERAITNTCGEWGTVAGGLFHNDNHYVARLDEWNLDTGKANGSLVYWG